MSDLNELSISAIAFQDDGAWIVQGIEYDIVAHAHDAAGLPAALARALVENACITEHLGRRPMEGVPSAPARFRELFDRALATITPVGDLNLPFPAPQMNIRLAA